MKVRTIRPTRAVRHTVCVQLSRSLCHAAIMWKLRNPGPDGQVDKLHGLSKPFQCAMQIMTEVRRRNVAMERQLADAQSQCGDTGHVFRKTATVTGD